MNLFEVLLIVAVVSLMASGILHTMGKKTAAKWLLMLGAGIGAGLFLLLWTVIKAAGKDSKRKRGPGGNFR